MLEGQAAAEQKGDQVIAPEVADLSPLLDQFAPSIDAVARQIGTQVAARGRARRLRVAGRVISISGQGLGLRVQKAANSRAASFGRITRLAG
jgi:hypothetical protein